MIIYRTRRGGLAEALAKSREFETEEEIKQYIMCQYRYYADGLLQIDNNCIDNDYSKSARYTENPLFGLDDIVIDDEAIDDERCGWHDARYVCVKRFGNENYMQKYGCPQCVGMCAKKYERNAL